MPKLSRRSQLGAALTDAECQLPAIQRLALISHHVP
jgi:hypothetical protein